MPLLCYRHGDAIATENVAGADCLAVISDLFDAPDVAARASMSDAPRACSGAM